MCEIEIENLERRFLAESCSAFAAAHERALASGQVVVTSQGGIIYRILPDGSREPIRHLKRQMLVKPGQMIHFAAKGDN